MKRHNRKKVITHIGVSFHNDSQMKFDPDIRHHSRHVKIELTTDQRRLVEPLVLFENDEVRLYEDLNDIVWWVGEEQARREP